MYVLQSVPLILSDNITNRDTYASTYVRVRALGYVRHIQGIARMYVCVYTHSYVHVHTYIIALCKAIAQMYHFSIFELERISRDSM